MIIADTGFWLALANRKDSFHDRAQVALDRLEEPLVTTWPVMTETCHLLLARLGVHAMLTFIRSFEEGAFEVLEFEQNVDSKLYALMDKYQTLPMDLADASLLLLAEKLGHGRIFSTDMRDFGTYRWKQHCPFDNLLLA